MSGLAGKMEAILTTSCGKVIVFPFKPVCRACGPLVEYNLTTYILGRHFDISNFSDSVKSVNSGGVFSDLEIVSNTELW